MGSKKGKSKSGKGKKKGKKDKPDEPLVMPGLPYGADPWQEVQPVTIPDPPVGHIRTVFPVGLIMPTRMVHAKEMARAEIAAADAEAALKDEVWERACDEVELSLKTVVDRATRYHDTNAFLEKLLTTSEADADISVRFLSDRSVKLHNRVLAMEEQCRTAQEEADAHLRLREEKNKVIIADLEKKLAERDHKLYDLALEHIDLRKLEKDRDAMQLSVDELRNSVYNNEKKHRKAVMQAEEFRCKAQRKAQEDSQAALEDLAKQGCVAAKENIAQQTLKLSDETDRLSELFRWVCNDVRKNREDVKQLQQLLDDCVLEHDSVVAACEGRLREYNRSKMRLKTLQTLTECMEKEHGAALAQLKTDSEKVFHSIEHSFYERDKEILRLKNTNKALSHELCKLRSTVKDTTSNHELVQRFIMTSLHAIKAHRVRQLQREDKRAVRSYHNRLKRAWKDKVPYPAFQLSRSVKVNPSLSKYRPLEIPDHEDISQLGWKEKEAIVKTMFRYLCDYQSAPTAKVNLQKSIKAN
ncbi:hypothetical protein BV898_02211 [Hypsibius exemplaris]|uniref:Coiled-coil domain-containing protein 176 n=1 Tax=Hypsibius exemplaris TaxID=2072580 RepID=A0A1W0X969_HYPEX|nr:hypothetical protein BV898_02211 [Hypsibius exemplaris]